MNNNQADSVIKPFIPILLVMAIVLVTTGCSVMLYFGYSVYLLMVEPDKSAFLKFVLSNLPALQGDHYVFKEVSNGQVREILVPAAFLTYGRFVLAFLIWGMLGGIVSATITAGTSIFYVLGGWKQTEQKKRQNLETI